MTDVNTYFDVPALNATLAKQLVKSAAHGKNYLDNPPKTTAAMAFGTVVHSAVLEPHKPAFATKRENWTTKAGKEERALLQELGLPILDEEESVAVRCIRENVMSIPRIADAIEKGEVEVPVYWTSYGVPCKARADLICGSTIYDLKTCTDASPRGFVNNVWRFGYHIQCAHYLEGFNAREFIFVAVETQAPYNVGLYTLSEIAINTGERAMALAAERYEHGMRTGEWPGYETGRVVVIGDGFSLE
jgi:hypothetical protein